MLVKLLGTLSAVHSTRLNYTHQYSLAPGMARNATHLLNVGWVDARWCLFLDNLNMTPKRPQPSAQSCAINTHDKSE